MITIRQGDIKTRYVSVEDDAGDPITPTSCFYKLYNPSTGTYLIKGTVTPTAGTISFQIPAALSANVGTFQEHWLTVFSGGDTQCYIRDIEITELFPSLPTLSYGDLATLKRYVRNISDKVKIGNADDANVSEVDATKFIRDGQRYIDGKLKKTKDADDLPLSTVPNEIHLAASILGAWFLLKSSFLSTPSDELSASINSLKDLADTIIDTYLEHLEKEGTAEVAGGVKYQQPDKMFTEVGVGGVTFGDVSGIRGDDDISDKEG